MSEKYSKIKGLDIKKIEKNDVKTVLIQLLKPIFKFRVYSSKRCKMLNLTEFYKTWQKHIILIL